MTLGFMQRFPWKVDKQPVPTHFREKILALDSLNDVDLGSIRLVSIPLHKPKVHTIRLDPHNRWKAGRKIEMVYRGAGYRIIDHFNKGIPELEKCVSVQLIQLWWTGALAPTQEERDNGVGHQIKLNCIVDGRRLTDEQLTTLAINDGFNSLDQFKKWFKEDFYGRIIHWADLKY